MRFTFAGTRNTWNDPARPQPRLVEFEGVGHAPMLMAQDQIAVVREFLLEN